jgi:hypothetical protein
MTDRLLSCAAMICMNGPNGPVPNRCVATFLTIALEEIDRNTEEMIERTIGKYPYGNRRSVRELLLIQNHLSKQGFFILTSSSL